MRRDIWWRRLSWVADKRSTSLLDEWETRLVAVGWGGLVYGRWGDGLGGWRLNKVPRDKLGSRFMRERLSQERSDAEVLTSFGEVLVGRVFGKRLARRELLAGHGSAPKTDFDGDGGSWDAGVLDRAALARAGRREVRRLTRELREARQASNSNEKKGSR